VDSILPLGVKTVGKIKRLEWLGGLHSDYMMPVVRKESEFIFNDFESKWLKILSLLPPFDVLHLTKQVPRLGDRENPFVTLGPSTFIMNSYQAIFDGGWEEYKQKKIRKNVLADSKRQRKRLSKLGKLEFIISNNKEDRKKFTEEMFLQKRKGYQEMGVLDVLKPQEHQNLYTNVPTDLGCTGKIHCSVLLLGKKVIASHWGILSKNTFYYLMPAYERGEWSKYSPGKLLLENLMIWCCENNIQTFDFTGGDETYKKIWANDSFPLSAVMKSYTPKGNLYLSIFKLKSILRRMPFIGKLLKIFKLRPKK
jgi:CelD/BcsL family acetyltransferase involved in cellulose biosynthesis